MAGLQPFSLGNVLAQVEGIRGARHQNALAQQRLDPSSLENRTKQLEFERLQNPAPNYVSVGPGSAVVDDSTGQVLYERDFKPQPDKTDPIIGAFQQARASNLIPEDMDFMSFVGAYKKPLVDMSTGGTAPNTGSNTQAADLGVPVGDTPWAHISDPKLQDKAKSDYLRDAIKRGDALREAANTAATANQDITRFLHLNKSNYTGAGMGVPLVKPIRKGFDEEFGEMVSLADKMTPGMRQGLPGAASDTDTAMFRNATVGPEQTLEANENIGLGLKVANQNLIDQKKFHANYLTANRHDVGWDSAWAEYLEANPIFDPAEAEAGTYKLNENRQSWKEYFYPGTDPKQPTKKDDRDKVYRERLRKHGISFE